MYEQSKDSDLSFLLGKEICQVAIGSYDVQFNWGNGGISVWWKFCYKAAGSEDEIVWSADNPEFATRTIRLLKAAITEAKCSEEGTLPAQVFQWGPTRNIRRRAIRIVQHPKRQISDYHRMNEIRLESARPFLEYWTDLSSYPRSSA
jgi:hypothetical protein